MCVRTDEDVRLCCECACVCACVIFTNVVYVRFLPVWHKYYVHVQVHQRIFSDDQAKAAVWPPLIRRSKDENESVICLKSYLLQNVRVPILNKIVH